MRILLVEDEELKRISLTDALERKKFEVLPCENPLDALAILDEGNEVDVIVTDLKMPKMNGIDFIKKVREFDNDVPIIVVTAYATVETAVDAMKLGAYDYITKPFTTDELILVLDRLRDYQEIVKENIYLRSKVRNRYRFENIIGRSKPMQEIYNIVRTIGDSDSTVLIQGESGTGKELIANAIHFNSSRRNKPLICVSCAALTESLFESEIFGHEKGAFTGAVKEKKGRFELADGGTIFLDDVDDIPLVSQVKLLRVLQEKTFERVGGLKPISVNFRLIAATNKKLKAEIAANRFREDLFYRLNVVYMQLPPLRMRREDIPLLTRHFLEKYADQRGEQGKIKGMEPEVERLFFDYEWAGNIRELENIMERAMIMCPGDLIRVADLPGEFRSNVYNTLHLEGIPADAKLYDTLADVERKMILRALKITNNVQTRAAELLGIGKSGLNQKIKKLGLDKILKTEPVP